MSSIIGTFNDITVALADGSGTPKTASLTLLTGSGELGPLEQGGRATVSMISQGVHVGTRAGDPVNPVLSLEGYLSTPLDAARSLLLGLTSGVTSTDALSGERVALDVTLSLNLTSPSSETRTVTLAKCQPNGLGLSLTGEGNRAKLELVCYGAITLTDAGGTARTLRAA